MPRKGQRASRRLFEDTGQAADPLPALRATLPLNGGGLRPPAAWALCPACGETVARSAGRGAVQRARACHACSISRFRPRLAPLIRLLRRPRLLACEEQ